MKTTLYTIFLLVFIIITSISCQKEEDLLPNSEQGLIDKSSDAYAFIKSLNYPDSLIKDAGEYYLIDCDIIVPKDLKYSGELKHTRDKNLVRYDYQTSIKIKIDSSIPSNSQWRTGISQAISAWNNISNCRINLTLITSGTEDILIRSDNNSLQDDLITGTGLPAEWYQPVPAASTLPLFGHAGDEILVNLDVNYGSYPPSLPTIAEMKFVITHNLGHCLGLCHTDRPYPLTYASWLTQWGRGDYVIPGSPDTGDDPDPNSVMNYGTAYKDNTFSSGDIAAIQYLYGKGIRICLKTFDNQHYVQATNGGGSSVDASSGNSWEWETFHLIESPTYGEPYYLLQTIKGQYLSAVNGGGGSVNASSTSAGPNETFELVESTLYPGKVLLKTKSSGHYLQAVNGGGGSLNASSSNPWAWESFEIVYSNF